MRGLGVIGIQIFDDSGIFFLHSELLLVNTSKVVLIHIEEISIFIEIVWLSLFLNSSSFSLLLVGLSLKFE